MGNETLNCENDFVKATLSKSGDVTERWSMFLDGVEEDKKAELAEKFDNLAKFLIEDEDYGGTLLVDDDLEVLEWLNVIAFPIMRVAFVNGKCESGILDRPEDFCDFIIAHFEDEYVLAEAAGQEDVVSFLCTSCAEHMG